jgi:hypothetical protein
MARRLPPACGADLDKPFIANVYATAFWEAARLRRCPHCRQVAPVRYEQGLASCGHRFDTGLVCGWPEPKRAYRHLALICGRQFGKTWTAAHLVREELQRARGVGWVCGPTYKYLNDSTMPTLLRLIPPDWVAHWSDEHQELRLINDHLIKFRSLDDPERGRGPTSHWAWLDEAALMTERAWDVLSPQLARQDGVCYLTTTPAGYDWVYHRFWVPAMVTPTPGFWAARAKSIEGAGMPATEIAYRRSTMPDGLFRQEYEADFVTLTGAVYGELIAAQTLHSAEAVRAVLPEWPQVSRDRPLHVGLDSGVDHPFAAVFIVATEQGLVVFRDYLARGVAPTVNLAAITRLAAPFTHVSYAANKNEAALRLEFAQHGLLVAPANNDQKAGILRVHSWLAAKRLWFVGANAGGDGQNAERTIRQLSTYRYAETTAADGSLRDRELVVKRDDDLPDGVRYVVMTYPTLPTPVEAPTGRDLQRLSAKDRADIERMRAYEAQREESVMRPFTTGWPYTEMWGPLDAEEQRG